MWTQWRESPGYKTYQKYAKIKKLTTRHIPNKYKEVFEMLAMSDVNIEQFFQYSQRPASLLLF